jgi:hypothetical protein
MGTTVAAPDGSRWRVRRRWLERPAPNLRQRFRANREEAIGEGGVEAFFGPSTLVDGPAGIALGVGLLVVLVVVLPVLGVALELVALLFVVLSGLFARVVLRRPWIVVGQDLDDRERRVAFAVEGWGDSVQATRELREAIAAAGPPERLSVGRPLATRPQVPSS